MVVLTSRVFWPIGPSWPPHKMKDEHKTQSKLSVGQNVNILE